MDSNTTRPVAVFRSSGISASVFKNRAKTEDRTTSFYKVSLQRTYNDGEKWKTTGSLSRNDLPIAALLLQKAWDFVVEAENTRQDDE